MPKILWEIKAHKPFMHIYVYVVTLQTSDKPIIRHYLVRGEKYDNFKHKNGDNSDYIPDNEDIDITLEERSDAIQNRMSQLIYKNPNRYYPIKSYPSDKETIILKCKNLVYEDGYIISRNPFEVPVSRSKWENRDITCVYVMERDAQGKWDFVALVDKT